MHKIIIIVTIIKPFEQIIFLTISITIISVTETIISTIFNRNLLLRRSMLVIIIIITVTVIDCTTMIAHITVQNNHTEIQ